MIGDITKANTKRNIEVMSINGTCPGGWVGKNPKQGELFTYQWEQILNGFKSIKYEPSLSKGYADFKCMFVDPEEVEGDKEE